MRIVKTGAIALSVLFTVGAFTACGKKKVPDTPQTLEIWVSSTGYGADWVDDIVDLFKQEEWVKEKYPELLTDITVNTTDDTFGFTTTVAGTNTYDLVINVGPGGQYYNSGAFEELSEVYESTIPGESLTLKQKMIPDMYKQYAYEQKNGSEQYYCVPWVNSTMGIFYNEKVVKDALGADYVLPKTTEELEKMCAALKKKTTPILASKDTNYWVDMFLTWWAQYEGIDAYERFWRGQIINEDGDLETHPSSMQQVGRLHSLQALDSILNYGKGYVYELRSIEEYKTIQNYFIKGRGALMCNGDWLANEMSSDAKDIRMMKTPVISYITERCTSVKTDAQLSAVVGYVDAENSYEVAKANYLATFGVELSSEDYKTISSARNMTYVLGGFGMHVPTASVAKELSKDFIRFCATDKAIASLMKTGKGYMSCYQYTPSAEETAGFVNLSKDRLSYAKNTRFIPSYYKYRTYIYGGLIPLWSTVNAVDETFMNVSSDMRLSPSDVYGRDVAHYMDNSGREFYAMMNKARN